MDCEGVSPALCLSSEVEGAGDSRSEFWHLRRGEESGAKLRFRGKTGDMLHFEGARGAERRVRAVRAADGEVEHYEGEQGAERCVRAEFANGMVQHYEGEGDAERMVRAEFADGMVLYYEGERGAERRVRAEYPDGEEWYYEGERDAERLVRKELADGVVHFPQPRRRHRRKWNERLTSSLGRGGSEATTSCARSGGAPGRHTQSANG